MHLSGCVQAATFVVLVNHNRGADAFFGMLYKAP